MLTRLLPFLPPFVLVKLLLVILPPSGVGEQLPNAGGVG